jgi:CRP-like cAMP-binding protein
VIEKHLLKLRARDDVSDEEEAVIRDLVSETRSVTAKTTIIHAGEVLAVSTLLLEGLMCRYKDLSNGQRQITEMHVAGDFVDLHSLC